MHYMCGCGIRVLGRNNSGTAWQSPSGETIMRKRLRDNGLSLTMFGLFLLFLLGQSIAGYYDYNAEQPAHQQPAVGYGAYLTSGHFWATVFENWESEFLQMAAYVVLTVFLFQRGSAESKDPDTPDEVDEDPLHHQHNPTVPAGGRTQGGHGPHALRPFPLHRLRPPLPAVLPRACRQRDEALQR